MMLVTTSRKPSDSVKAMTRALAKGFGAQYHNRGKAGIKTVLVEAEKKGANRVLFLWAKHGNPARIVVWDGLTGDWLKPELSIKGFVFNRLSFRKQGCTLIATDKTGETYVPLFEAQSGPNQILLSEFGLKLFINRELLLELRFYKQEA